MEPMEREREDSSNYVSQQPARPVTHEEPQPVTPVEPPKKKKSKAAAILAGLFLLALLVAGMMAWLWYQQSGRVDNLEADLSKARNDVARLESAAKAEEQLDDNSSVTTDTEDSDSEAIVKTALAYETAEATPLSGLNAVVAYNQDDFAKVNITSSTTGHFQILKKSNDLWVVVFSGNAQPSQEVIDRYEIPAAVLE